jgi:hypothetical protein
MKCPSCSAHLKPSASRCGKCGHQFEKGSAKRTMMGLPAMKQGNEGAEDEPTKEFDRSTLFGIPAANDDEKGDAGLSEGTSPSRPGEETQTEAAATQVVSDLDIDAVMGGDGAAQPGDDPRRSTAAGIPAADDGADSTGNDVASAWGLDEESSEADSPKTQVAGAALADAILESKQGAGGFSRTAPESKSDDDIKGTLMGMTREQLAEQDAAKKQDTTKEVDRSQLEGLPGYQTPQETGAAGGGEDDEDDDSTQALAAEELEKFEENIQSDRRRQLLNKLRTGSKEGQSDDKNRQAAGSDPRRETARGVPSAPSNTGPSGASQVTPSDKPSQPAQPPAKPPPTKPPAKPKPPEKPAPSSQSRPPGPKFSIPTPSADKPKADQQDDSSPPELEVEPLTPADEAPQEQQRPSLGGGKTSFPIPTGKKRSDESSSSAQPADSDEDLELALGDTGVITGADDEALQPGDQQPDPGASGGEQIREFVEEDPGQLGQPGQSGGIREFTDDGDDGEPIFPIDSQEDQGQMGQGQMGQGQMGQGQMGQGQMGQGQMGQFGSDQGVAATPAQSQPHRASVPSGETPLPGPPPETAGQPAATSAPPGQPADHQQAAPDAQQDPTEKLVRTVQVLFGLLSGLFLLGAGAFGFISGSTDNTVQLAMMVAPALVGLLTLVVSVVPMSSGAKNGSYFAMAALAIAALVGGAVLSAPIAVLLVVFGGVLLVLCAGAFPLVLNVIQ